MARHRVRRAGVRWLWGQPSETAPPEASNTPASGTPRGPAALDAAPTAPVDTSAADPVTAPERVVCEALPTQPREVTLNYPDGTTLPVDYMYGGPAEGRERWIALVPATARIADGMVIRVSRDLVLAVALREPEDP